MLTIARVLDTDFTFGNLRGAVKDITLDTSYPTGGYALTGTALVGSGITLLGVQFMGGNNVAGGYQYAYDNVNKKLMVFRAGGFTPAGTVAAPTFTGSALGTHNHTFTGTELAAHDHTIPVTTGTAGDAVTNNAGVLESTGGQDLTSSSDTAGTPAGTNAATSGGTPAGTNSAPAFTGTAVAAGALVQVANAVNLSTVKIRVFAIGR